MTRTALAAGMAVLGTLVLLRHRSGTDVATSTVGKTAPGATDVGAGAARTRPAPSVARKTGMLAPSGLEVHAVARRATVSLRTNVIRT